VRSSVAKRLWVLNSPDDFWRVYDEGRKLELWKNPLAACKRTGVCPISLIDDGVARLFGDAMLFINTNTLPHGDGYQDQSPSFCRAYEIVSSIINTDRDRKLKRQKDKRGN
jgi:hypothetical protein